MNKKKTQFTPETCVIYILENLLLLYIENRKFLLKKN